MTQFDNKHWLLNHIKHSFMSCDDTGVCESVMMGVDVAAAFAADAYPNAFEEGDDEFDAIAHSGDIHMGASHLSSGHRRHSNTAQRLERMKREKAKQQTAGVMKPKIIHWREGFSPNLLTSTDMKEMFASKAVNAGTRTRRGSSTLTQLMQEFPQVNPNPFREYAVFDGTHQTDLPVCRVSIYLDFLPESRKNYPVRIVALASARVKDVIGLTLCRCFEENPEEKLKANVEKYSLYIAEDNGDVDWDFPQLELAEIFGKFGFDVLALVYTGSITELNSGESEIDGTSSKDSTRHEEELLVTVELAPDCSVEFKTKSTTPLHNVVNEAVSLKKMRRSRTAEFELRLQDCTDALDLHCNVSDVAKGGRCSLVVQGEIIDRRSTEDKAATEAVAAIEAPLYQSYRVALVSRMRARSEILLGISGEKLELDPVQGKGVSLRQLWPGQQRAVPTTYDTETILSCELTGTDTFRIVVAVPVEEPGEEPRFKFRKHVFEADDDATAREIVRKMNDILTFRTSTQRKEYLLQLQQQKKRHKKENRFSLR